MEQEFSFQWQNPSLMKTIYPLRERKLRDFLYFYQEIDLWKVYKDKTLEDIAGEVRAYHEAEARRVRQAVGKLARLEKYFTTPDVRANYAAKFPDLDENEIKKINLIHSSFAKYYPNFNHPRKEKYFISQQIYLYEPRRNEIKKHIDLLQRRYNAILPDHPSRPGVLANLEKLKSVALPMVDTEYNLLRELLEAHATLEPRKLEISNARTTASRQENSLTRKLNYNLSRQAPLKSRRSTALAEINRLKSPPELAPLEKYFSTKDVSPLLQRSFPGANADQIKTINNLHTELVSSFSYTKSTRPRMQAIKNYVYRLEQAQRAANREVKKLETSLRNMGPTWKYKTLYETNAQSLRASLPAFDKEINYLNDYWAAMNAATITPANRDNLFAEKESSINKLDKQLETLNIEADTLRKQLTAAKNILKVPEATQLLQAKPSKPLTVRDIVRGKLQAYNANLAEKDQSALLEEIVARFRAEPNRYPAWVQYMVIHFSGMRYQSAHGSWADPRELLANLRTSAAEKEFNSLSDSAQDALLEQKAIFYGALEGKAAKNLEQVIAPLKQASSEKWQRKVAQYIKGLKSPSVYRRRKALLELLMDEANYAVETLTDEEVLETFEDMKDELPSWMWKEIVRVTNLKVKYVDDEDWERLNAKEQAEKADYRWQEYRQMISKWREKGTTAWREEHDQTNQLIVTRAVCNETAEHIQHIRGHSPPGGLAARPKWYQGMESAGADVPAGDQAPHFIIPRSAEDFTSGASILWLTFVNNMPHAWSIARPLSLKSGEGLLPAQLFGNRNITDRWRYKISGNTITRSRNKLNEKNKKTGVEQQYLRWNHEATVVEVAETAEGTVILTFETARPHDDRRLSSVGMFKHYVNNLVYKIDGSWFNATFVGYTPEGEVPVEDLEFMLDWDRILPPKPRPRPNPRTSRPSRRNIRR